MYKLKLFGMGQGDKEAPIPKDEQREFLGC